MFVAADHPQVQCQKEGKQVAFRHRVIVVVALMLAQRLRHLLGCFGDDVQLLQLRDRLLDHLSTSLCVDPKAQDRRSALGQWSEQQRAEARRVRVRDVQPCQSTSPARTLGREELDPERLTLTQAGQIVAARLASADHLHDQR